MSRVAIMFVMAAGCAHHDKAIAPGATGGDVVEQPMPPAPSKVAPTVSFTDGVMDMLGLPAMAADGSLVVVAHQDADGGRGNPNLTLIAIDRHDVHVKTLVVLTVDDYEMLAAKPNVAKERFAIANRWLAKLHAEKRLVALDVMNSGRADGADDQCRCVQEGEHATIAWRSNVVKLAWDKRPLAEKATPTSWLVADRPMYKGSTETCHHAARLDGAAINRERRLALLIVSYDGTDTCWEPSNQEHVVIW